MPGRAKSQGNTQPKALSLFSGAGGFCEGMKVAGFRVVAAVEKDSFACETYRHNFPETKLFEGDVADFARDPSADALRERDLHDLDMIFGGPPCQGYSQIGTRDIEDPRNQLYKEFTRLLTVCRPRMFVMENVPNMLLLRKGIFKDAALAEFKRCGYPTVHVVLVDASEFGIPQQRRRVFYIGVRDDLSVPHALGDFVDGALNEYRLPSPVTVWDAISDLPPKVVDSGEVTSYRKPKKLTAFQREMRADTDGVIYQQADKLGALDSKGSLRLHNHHTKEIQARRLHLIGLLKPGAKANSLPIDIWNGARPEKWRRLHPDQPAYTLLANMHRDLSEFVHPSLNRWITVREAMRLQSFHDGFIAKSSEWQQLKQIGNAVPPLLARIVGKVALDVLQATRGAKINKRYLLPPGHQFILLDAPVQSAPYRRRAKRRIVR